MKLRTSFGHLFLATLFVPLVACEGETIDLPDDMPDSGVVQGDPDAAGPADEDAGADAGMAVTPDATTGVPDASISAGMVELNTDTVDFGDVVITSTATRVLTIRNPGAEPVRVTLTPPTGRDADRFTATPDTMVENNAFVLAAGATVEVTIAVTPLVEGSLFATLALDSCMGGCPVSISLIAEGVQTGVTCPDDLDLGLANPGSCITAVTGCENRGNLTERITVVDLEPSSDAAFSLTPPGLPVELTAGSSISISIEYCPTEVGTDQAEVLVATFMPQEVEHTIEVTGRGGGADVSCTPMTLDLGTLGIGGTATGRITCRNSGSDPAVIAALPGGGSNAVTVTMQPGMIAAGQSDDIVVEVSGVAAGTINDSVQITTNDPDTPMITVPLTAEVVMIGPCAATITPSDKDFGLVTVGDVRRQTFIIRNTGMSTCLVQNVDFAMGSDSEFTLRQPVMTGATIAAGATLSFDVEFRPTGSDPYTGRVVASFSNPMASDLTAMLSGTGGNASLVAEPRAVNFGVTPVGCAAPTAQNVLFRNVGNTVTVTAVQLVTSSSVSFQLTNIPMLPARVARFGTLTVGVEFDPSSVGTHTADIRVRIQGQAQPIIVSVTGIGELMPTRTDTFNFASPQVDIMFVIDDSCSMQRAQQALSTAINPFADVLASRGVDYHIGMVTTDMADPRKSGRLQGMPTFLTPATPMVEDLLRMRMQPGTRGSGSEQGIRAARTAVTNPLATGANQGFLRSSADLAVIIISDEPDGSPEPPTIASSAGILVGAAGAGQASVSAIVGPATTNCTGPYGTGQRATDYHEFATRVGNGLILSYCDNMSANMQAIANDLFGGPSFRLGAEPLPATVQVQVNGMTVNANDAMGNVVWSYDAMTQSVVFTDGNAPANGAVIAVTYRPYCLSPTCGDGTVDANEECDDGNMSNTDACVDGCRNASCGDGFVQAMVEECDDANNVNTDMCVAGCRAPRCGDGYVQAGVEECDDGNNMNGDMCPANCQVRDTFEEFYNTTGLSPFTYTPLTNSTTITFTGGGSGGRDDGVFDLPMPFAFRYFDVTTTTITISPNGLVGFSGLGAGAATVPDQASPNMAQPNDIIAVWWEDLFIDTGVPGGADVSYQVIGNAPNRLLVVQWRGLRKANMSTQFHRRFDFQLALGETTGVIQLRYGQTNTTGTNRPTDASVGMENATGTLGVELLTCSPNCDGRPRPPQQNGFPQNSSLTATPVP